MCMRTGGGSATKQGWALAAATLRDEHTLASRGVLAEAFQLDHALRQYAPVPPRPGVRLISLDLVFLAN